MKRNTRHYNCGNCGASGHSRLWCPEPLRDEIVGFVAGDYEGNRQRGLCVDCGTPSTTARCATCCERRKQWPSRQQRYREKHEARRKAS